MGGNQPMGRSFKKMKRLQKIKERLNKGWHVRNAPKPKKEVVSGENQLVVPEKVLIMATEKYSQKTKKVTKKTPKKTTDKD